MRWHVDERKYDENYRHVVDSLQQTKFDSLLMDFGIDPRNLRIGLAQME